MTKLWPVGVLLVGFGLTAACGDGTEPITADTIAIVDGDDQRGPLNVALPVPLRVAVTGSNGAAFVGGTVTWQISPTTGGTTNPASGPTGANGQAQATVTLGTFEGDITVTATIGGLPPATFGATAVHPCDWLVPHTVGTTVTGTLSTVDCDPGDGSFVDLYNFTRPPSGPGVQLTMTSFFTNAVFLFDLVGGQIAGQVGANTQLKAFVPPGDYVVGANSSDPAVTGSYTLASQAVPATVTGCEFLWLAGPLTFSDQIETTDCVGTDDVAFDYFILLIYPSRVFTATLSASAYSPQLRLYDAGPDTLVGEATGSATTPAELSFTNPGPDPLFYFLEARSALANATGPYALTVSDFTPPAAPFAGAPVQTRRPLAPLAPRELRARGIRRRG